jgi:hypothetical protein
LTLWPMKSGISAASDHEKPYAVRIAKSRGVEPCDKTGARRDWSQIPSFRSIVPFIRRTRPSPTAVVIIH